MGGWFSYIWWGGDPDEVNQESGLTKREIYVVQKSWALVFANCVFNGTELFKRLFRAYPETKTFFTAVRKLSEEELSRSAQFKAHVINLMSSLNQAILHLDQPEIAAAMMSKLGESHRKRKIEQRHFDDMKKVIVEMWTTELKLDNFTLSAWDKTIDFLFKHLFITLNDETEG